MALVSSNYIKYDMTEQEYYINTDCVTKYTTYTNDELGQVGLNDKAIKIICHNVYRLIYDIRRNRYEHKKYMRKKIYDNAYEEVTALRRAMVEAVKGAIESGMDLNAYLDEPSDILPYTVVKELKEANLIDLTLKVDYELDFTYTEEDEGIAT